MNIVIYARYSSHSQTEQSIEGQLQTCYEFAKNNGHIVIGEYIDRAQSGTTDSRAEFQRMIADSDKHIFEGVLVYQLDRFARNRYDSAINKAKLKKNGVRVISARENISDDARVVLECRKLLTGSNIEKIALAVAAACEADYDNSAIKRIKAAIQEEDAAIENLWKALERGQAVDMIAERIEKRKQEKNELQGQLAIEMGKQVTFTAPQIKAFLYSLKRGNVNDENNRRGMVNIFLRAIYLYDDRMTLILNGGDRPITIDNILLDEIEEHFEDAVSSHAGCSPLVAAAPPFQKIPPPFHFRLRRKLHAGGIFFSVGGLAPRMRHPCLRGVWQEHRLLPYQHIASGSFFPGVIPMIAAVFLKPPRGDSGQLP